MSIPFASHASPLPSVIGKRGDEDEDRARTALIVDRYKEIVSALPKAKGRATIYVYMYQGFWHPSGRMVSVESVMALQDSFKALPTDIYLASSPKSGTTWLKALAFALVNRNRYKNNSLLTHLLLESNPHNCVPFVETEVFRNTPTYAGADAPRLFATHMAYTSLPESILDHSCRLVYICRNPKDVFVSWFHFANILRDKSRGLMTFEETFEMFCKGIVPYGPYWDHVKGYRKANLAHPQSVLFLTYEEMTKDTVNNVKRLAKFLGYPFTEEEEAGGAVQEIVKLCSFEKLSDVNKHGNLIKGVSNDSFFREGKVGDWTNHLTDEMSRILDEITEEKFNDLDISF